MRGEIIAIGDELVSGQRLDTNSQWLSERLGEIGIDVAFHTSVGDDLAANVEVFRAAFARVDVVVATGGLGPTADDLTRDALAEAVGVELVEDAVVLEHIRQLYAKRRRQMPERNALQARFPRGARPIPNPYGTAPGIALEVARDNRPPCLVFALPGVPAEMRELWVASVEPELSQAQPEPRVTRHRRVKCFGVGESDLEAMLPDLIRRGREPRVGITASKATLTLRITASGSHAAACDAAMASTLAEIYARAGDLIFGEEDDELQNSVVRMLRERGQTLAVGDAATDDLLGHWLAEADTGHEVLIAAEERHRSAPETEADVRRWALALRDRHGAHFALAIGHAQDGTSTIVLARPEEVEAHAYTTAGHPSLIKDRLAKQAMDLLRRHLLHETAGGIAE